MQIADNLNLQQKVIAKSKIEPKIRHRFNQNQKILNQSTISKSKL